MALGLLQPAVNEFLNSVVFDAEKHTELGEIEGHEQSGFVGKTLRDRANVNGGHHCSGC